MLLKEDRRNPVEVVNVGSCVPSKSRQCSFDKIDEEGLTSWVEVVKEVGRKGPTMFEKRKENTA